MILNLVLIAGALLATQSLTGFVPGSDSTVVINGFWNRVATARTGSFMAQLWQKENDKRIVLSPYWRVARTHEVTFARPNKIAIIGSPVEEYETGSIESGTVQYTFLGDSWTTRISDGRRQLELMPFVRQYKLNPPLTSLRDAFMMGPDLTFSFIFRDKPMAGLKQLNRGGKAITGQFAFTDSREPDVEYRFTFDVRTGELKRLGTWYRSAGNSFEEVDRVVFMHWLFNPPIAPYTFGTTPPPGYVSSVEADARHKSGNQR